MSSNPLYMRREQPMRRRPETLLLGKGKVRPKAAEHALHGLGLTTICGAEIWAPRFVEVGANGQKRIPYEVISQRARYQMWCMLVRVALKEESHGSQVVIILCDVLEVGVCFVASVL